MGGLRSVSNWLSLSREVLSHGREVLKRERARRRGIPTIFFNSVEKSGASYITKALCDGLGLPDWRVESHVHGRYDIIIRGKLPVVQRGGIFVRPHLPANRMNLVLLQCALDRLIVHVRDPRQTMLSRVHYTHWLKEHGSQSVLPPLLELADPALPENYFAMSLTDQIGWHIDNYLPWNVEWIEKWLDASEDPQWTMRIHFTRFEDFVQDVDAFLDGILAFYEIDRSLFTRRHRKGEPGKLNFRKGLVDEWRTAFTQEQATRASQMVPERLKERFGWHR